MEASHDKRWTTAGDGPDQPPSKPAAAKGCRLTRKTTIPCLTYLTHLYMFRDRIGSGREIALHELTYPVLQGYDSFAMDSDLTIVGSDQLFNEMMGRHYQQRLGAEPQALITTRITPGLDGGPKQSKSIGNYVALLDSPQEKFGKLMSLPDDLVEVWGATYTDLTDADVEYLAATIVKGSSAARDVKLTLAEEVLRRYHGLDVAKHSRRDFVATFSQRQTPEDMPALVFTGASMMPLDLARLARPELSNSALRRLLTQGAIRVDGIVIRDEYAPIDLTSDAVLRMGPRSWWRLLAVDRS